MQELPGSACGGETTLIGFENRLLPVTPVTAWGSQPPHIHGGSAVLPKRAKEPEGMGGCVMHAQTKGWGSAPGADPLRVALPPDRRVAATGTRGPGLAPARGVLLGSVMGSACWALVVTLTWLALQS